ncbi:hypothetical protein, partial [Bartonella bovis]|uniref:hypothetical protein n=1 Tax=Bartonella bovis TaxID=155194 RepID=UPI00178C6BEC
MYMGSGTVVMDGVKISKVEKGVSASKGTVVMKGGTKITFAGGDSGYGVKVWGGGNALLNDITITGSGDKSTGVV